MIKNNYLYACLSGLCATAFFLSGCGDSIVDNDTALAKQKQLLLSKEYVGSEIELVDYKQLLAAQTLVPQPKSESFNINDKVGIEGDYYIYNIHTPHATYMTKGTHALVQYCYESRIIEMFLNSKHGNELVGGVGEYVTESLKGVGNLLSHPVDSVKGVGRSFDVMVKSVGGDVKGAIKGRPVDKNRYDRDVLPGSSMYARELLKIAFSMKADAYTLNPHMQGLLTNLAGKREIGRAFFSMVTWVVPGGSALSFGEDMSAWGQKGLNGGGGSVEVEMFISEFTPDDLLIRVAGFYKEKLGLDNYQGSPVARLIENVSYSPRQQAYIAYYLDELKRSGAQGVEDVIKRFANAGTVFEGIYNSTQLEMLHALSKEYSVIRRFVIMKEQIGAIVNAGQFIVIPLWDHTRQRQHVRDLLVEARNLAQTNNIGSPQVWFVGDCDRNVIDVAKQAGIKVRYGVAADQTFRFTSYRKLSYKRESRDPVPVDTGTVTRDQSVYDSRHQAAGVANDVAGNNK